MGETVRLRGSKQISYNNQPVVIVANLGIPSGDGQLSCYWSCLCVCGCVYLCTFLLVNTLAPTIFRIETSNFVCILPIILPGSLLKMVEIGQGV